MVSSAPLTQPLFFEPLFMERVWGGRRIEQLYAKRLPPRDRVGESWELVDREDSQSVVHAGPLRGATLQELWTGPRREEIFGPGWGPGPRFPLLFKILDAQDRLSLQVHPPAALAATLGGEAKTEAWYVAHADPGAEIYVGLAAAETTRELFEQAVHAGRAAELVHRVPVRAGDCMFIPSGRLHAIGAGSVIIEVQQNSDTTYRVYDWDRLDHLTGKPRALHLDRSLPCIDFTDVRPRRAGGAPPPPAAAGAVADAETDAAAGAGPGTGAGPGERTERLVECPFFRLERWSFAPGDGEADGARPALAGAHGRCAVFTVLHGRVDCAGAAFVPGDFFLVPAALADAQVRPLAPDTLLLRTTRPDEVPDPAGAP